MQYFIFTICNCITIQIFFSVKVIMLQFINKLALICNLNSSINGKVLMVVLIQLMVYTQNLFFYCTYERNIKSKCFSN